MRKSVRRGFTLVELMVSLVAGVVIAISVVGLARTATTAFYENIRVSSVESSVRIASERLRTDLLRAGFMSTGNIKYDPTIATVVNGNNSRYATTNDLQSIMISVGGSTTAAKNGLSPDRIRIAGNMTSDDAFRGRLVDANTLAFDGISDPATARLLATGDKDAAVRNAFAPKAGSKFLIRVVDKHRCQHFVELAANPAGSVSGLAFTLSMGNALAGSPVLLQSEVSTANCGASVGDSDLVVNPVTRVDWWLGADAELPASVQPVVAQSDAGVEDPSYKFNLYRQQLDSSGTGINGPEIIAEFAVDLKFGLVVHDLGAAPPSNYKNLDMTTGGTDITEWTKPVSNETAKGQPGPQRVRSVQYRVATRTPLGDRTADISVSQPGFISRYCVNPTCTNYARVRTLVSEVALVNQERSFY